MIISLEVYNNIVSKIQNYKGRARDLESNLADEFKLPKNTISSIISNENKRKTKKTHYKMSNMIPKLFERYTSLKASGEKKGVMIKIADEIDVPYTLFAKAMLEKFYEQEENASLNGSKSTNIKQFLKDSTLIDERDLAYEVFLCQLFDNQYGNINDVIRHSLGLEYEYRLQEIVKEKNLTYQSEDDLRIYGYDKTPDIKLDVPFAVDGFVVNWIESKALFADPEEHKNYTNDQYSSYWNRFGTGLVIYWLGMVDTIIDPMEKRFIVRTDFPENITLTDPFVAAKIPPGVKLEKEEEKSEEDKKTETL